MPTDETADAADLGPLFAWLDGEEDDQPFAEGEVESEATDQLDIDADDREAGDVVSLGDEDDEETPEPDEAGEADEEVGLDDLFDDADPRGDVPEDGEDTPVDIDLDEDDGSNEVQTGWEDTRGDRDDRIGDYDGDAGYQDVKSYVRERGTAEDLRDRLEDLNTREEDMPVAEGEELDLPNVIRRLAGDTTVEDYYRRRVERPGAEMAVGVSLDVSGSMSSVEKETKAAVGAFLWAVQQSDDGDVVAAGWDSVAMEARVRLITAPREPFEWRHLDAVEPQGGTPTSQGILETGNMLSALNAQNKLLVVITDGHPTDTSRDDLDIDDATEEATETVAEFRQSFPVVGFGFGDISEGGLEDIFGVDGYRHVEIDDLADALVEVYEEQRPGPKTVTPP